MKTRTVRNAALWLSLTTLGMKSPSVSAQTGTVRLGFDDPADLARLSVKGKAVLDSEFQHEGVSSLRLDPGASVEIALRPQDGSGRVELWVYDGMEQPADPKARRTGPRWGVRQSDGRMLVAGRLFAPYLSGERTYVLSETADPGLWLSKVAYLGESRRSEGWHRWVFDLDAAKGLVVSFDGKDVNAARKRFDWNQSQFGGVASVVLFGDVAAGGWPLWVDSLEATLGGAMAIQPTPPPPPPPVVPEKDPSAAAAVALSYKDLAVHPRLLFGPEDVVALKAYAASPEGQPLVDKLLGYLPACKPGEGTEFLKDATDGQRQGFWRMPTVALHYVLTGDGDSLRAATGFLRKLHALDHWELGEELDSGMSAANLMIGAALAFDWTHDALEPGFREAFRGKLWHHARAMYHGGHLMKNPGTHYWQGDPQNNHRWHRDAGMALAALAAARGTADEQWLLSEISDELAFIARWLPADGTSHESASYLAFGASHLTLALQAGDRAFGSAHLAQPFFRNTALFRLHSLLPGFQDGFSYGDGAGLGSYNGYLFKALSIHPQPDLLAGVEKLRDASPKAFEYAWFDLVWTAPGLERGRLDRVPTVGLFPDIGTLFVRDGWGAAAAAAMFRCMPFGGQTLNRYRNENDFRYINVAHDDPDANSFVLVSGSHVLAETDRYSKAKRSSNHNTVLVNGVGQEASGRAEGGGWSQPAGGAVDMAGMAFLTGWKRGDGIVAIEGEAAGSYPALNDRRRNVSRPALDRFRRTFLWVEGKYVLVLDDLGAPAEVTYDWLLQGPKLEVVDEGTLRFRLVDGSASCAVQLAADTELSTVLRASTADQRGKPLGWTQLVATAKVPGMRVASVYALWGGEVGVALETPTATDATLRVRHGAGTDLWTWQAPTSRTRPGRVVLEGEPQPRFEFSSADAAPDPEGAPACE